jgi:hypothetical protein
VAGALLKSPGEALGHLPLPARLVAHGIAHPLAEAAAVRRVVHRPRTPSAFGWATLQAMQLL